MGRIKWILIAGLAILFNSLSCGVDINPSINLLATPNSLDFGSILIGKSSTKTIELSNNGTQTIVLTDILLVFDDDNPDKGEIAITEGTLSSNFELSYGMSFPIGITFAPSVKGSKSVNLDIIYMSGKSQKKMTIPIIGTAIESLIRITPEMHDFGHSYLNEEYKKKFTITNIVFKQVTIESIELIDFGSATAGDEITITSGWNFSPKILEISETIEIEITFTPKSKTEKSARMQVIVADSQIDYFVELSGWGSDIIEFVTSSPLPEGVKGSSYEVNFEATGGDGNYTFTVISGKLPDGLTLTSLGEISGEPEEHGDYMIVVRLSDSSNNTTIKSFNLKVTYASLIRDPQDSDTSYIFSESDDEGLYIVNLINIGVTPLNITSISLTGAGAVSGEATILNQPALPETLQPSETTNITIKVESDLDEGRTVSLRVEHTGFNSPFGVNFRWRVEGDRYIFIIDASGSMLTRHNVSYPVYDQDGNIIVNTTRWQVAVYDISEVLADLEDTDKFEVIVFEGPLHYFFGQMAYAYGSNRYDSIAWLFNFPVRGCSNMYDGMYNGFHNYGTLSEMYVYSDGGANTALLLGCAGCACGGWIGARTVTDCRSWVPAMSAINPDFHLYMLQYAASPTGFMQQIGAMANCSYTLK
ncbi:MAG: choice-of-anchor D domain-containing protein [Planctomycetes bacterium]|nr:choice-of-anchor D domain-containing protein [Planctomycetota bacterium]